MPRYFIELKYDGTHYHGWQVQKNAIGIQEVLNKALSVVFRMDVETLGCGRTDTGVHARQFFVHLDLPETVDDCDNVVHRLNGLLPFDIAILRFFKVNDTLNARFNAVARTYHYHIYFHKDPFLKAKAYHLHFNPDVKKMQEAATELKQYNDFSCFSKTRTQVKTNICKISEARWITETDGIIFRITADRFLRGMVRAIVGSLLWVGEDKITFEDFKKILENKDRKQAGASVPACGLYLQEVKYHSFD